MRAEQFAFVIAPALLMLVVIRIADSTRLRGGQVAPSEEGEAFADIRQRIERVISIFERIPISVTDSPWRIFHSLHAKADPECLMRCNSTVVSYDKWLSFALAGRETYAGMPLVYLDGSHPRFSMALPTRGIGLEAHLGQFEWIISGAGISADSPVLSAVTTESWTLADCYETMLESVNEYSDLSWALPVAILHLPSPQHEWRNCFGVSYSLERMIQQHLDNAGRGVHCCGTHWYIGLAATSHRLGDLSPELKHRVVQRLSRWIGDLKRTGVAGSVPDSSTVDGQDGVIALTYIGHTLEAVMTLDSALRPDWRREPWLSDAVSDLVDRCEAQMSQQDVVSDDLYGAMAHGVHALRMVQYESNWSSRAATRSD